MAYKAQYFYRKKNNKVKCKLCPHECSIPDSKYGKCNVRKNVSGTLISENYGLICSIHPDPIEKKPLYHFFPGKNILSIGSIGCNLKCKFCQNNEISQVSTKNFKNFKKIKPDKIIEKAVNTTNNIGIAYTYNEPTVWYEFMLDTAIKAKKNGLKNIVVSNGFINKKPLKELLKYIDAFNIDLKAYDKKFYKSLTKSRLNPVLKTLKRISKSDAHLEITNLVIPNYNDDKKNFEEMLKHISTEYGEDTVLHLSRYFPRYKFKEDPTPPDTLLKFYETARKYLKYVYLGNIASKSGQDTICPKCNKILIKRTGYSTSVIGIDKRRCSFCNEKINIIV